jgi:hypothetical protein
MTAATFEDYIDKLNEIPAEVIDKLHHIRNIDK